MNFAKFIVVILSSLAAFVFNADGQTNDNGVVWKKRVSREINMKDTFLFRSIINAIKESRIIAYKYFVEQRFSYNERITQADLNEMLLSIPDTIKVTDPITGDEVTRIINRKTNFDSIYKYRIYEDWVFKPCSGKTEVKIIGIAPMVDVYGADGEFRGCRQLFLLRYDDATNLFDEHDKSHLTGSLIQLFWDDYFTEGISIPKNQEEINDPRQRFKKKLIRVIDMQDELNNDDHSISHHIQDENWGHSFPEIIFGAIDSQKLVAYPMTDVKYVFNAPLKIEQVYEMRYPKEVRWGDDTSESNNEEYSPCIGGLSFSALAWIRKFAILEDYSFDTHDGKMKIQILAVSPIGNIYDHTGKPHPHTAMFWLNPDFAVDKNQTRCLNFSL